MVLAQQLIDINHEGKPNYTSKITPEKEKTSLTNPEGMGTLCVTSCEETVTGMSVSLGGKTETPICADDVVVNIIECTNDSGPRLTEVEDPDATECSSSFADTASDTDTLSGLSEAEAESYFFSNSAFGSAYDEFGSIFQARKKKLTSHWRSFIRPLMWRCKWTELRIKEIEYQALKYSRELAAYDERKLSGIEPSMLEGFGSRSLPYSNQCYRRRALKRRRRKKVEDTTDVVSYMSQHKLFSYLETKRSNLDGAALADDFCSTVMDQRADCNDKPDANNDQTSLEFREGDNTLEQILWKIEMVHSRVHKMKSQVDLLLSKNAAKFSSSENLSLLAPCEVQTSSAPSPTFSAGNGDTISVGAIYNPAQNISEYDMADLVLPESAISSYEVAFHVPDIIESTVGLLSAADVTFHQPQIGDSCEDILDNVLIHNEAVEAERDAFLRTGNQPTEVLHEAEKGEEGESTNPSHIPTSETDHTTKTTGSQEQSTLESCLASDIHVPRNKRKRGERKAGSVGWNKKHSGDPDSQ